MSERAKWWGFTIVIVVLIVASNVVMYELGRRSVIQNIEYGILGNETTQTARAINEATMQGTMQILDVTMKALDNASSTSNALDATAAAITNAQESTRNAETTATMAVIYAIRTEHAYTITPSAP